MLPISRSAILRALRTLLQIALGWLTVDRLQAWVLDLDLSADVETLLVGVATAVLAFLHRRFLDPSRVPSLVDDPLSSSGVRVASKD